MKSVAAPLSLLGTLLVVVPAIAAGQSLDVVVKGRVVDETGAPLPGVAVTAIHEGTGVMRSATSDPDGRYVLVDLPASTYDVRAELDGFAAKTIKSQALYVGTTVSIDFSLRVSATGEYVEVRGQLPALEPDKNVVTRIVQRDEIDSLPVVNRNFNDLAALAPGVTKTGVYGGVDINGSRDFQNGYQVDGLSAKNQRLGSQRMPYAQDWIQEFQVMTSQFAVEFGQASGGILNVITRSGGSQTMGRVYGFFRDDALDATPAFASVKPPLAERRVGATLGGPIVQRRVFYFAGVEGFGTESSNIVHSTFASANGAFPTTDRQTLSLVKIDGVVNETQMVRVRYTGQRDRTEGTSIGGASTQEHGKFGTIRANDLAGTWSWILSPGAANDLRASWSTTVPQDGCNFATANPPGTWFERNYPGAQFGCPVGFGMIAENQLQLIQNLSWLRGRHDVKLGVQAVRTSSFGDFRNFRDGRYVFDRDLPFSLDDPASYPFSFTRIEGPTVWDVSSWAAGGFVQDGWRLADAVTLNLGVRYDVDGALSALNPFVRVDKGLHTVRMDVNNVAPRAGVAWRPFHDDRRTVVRAGTGLYYDQNHNNVATAMLLNTILTDRITTVNATNALLNPFGTDVAAGKRLLAGALAQNTAPDLSAMKGVAGSANDVDAGLQVPAALQSSAGVAHEFRRWVSVSADFVYARGFDLYVIRDVNLDPVTLRRLNPNYSGIASFGNGGWNSYKALQVQVNVLPSTRQLLKIAYTLAADRGNTGTTLSTGLATNPFDYSEDEGPTDNDVRHVIAANGHTSLPLGFEASGIWNYRSALPYSAVINAPRPDGKPFGFRPEPRNGRRGDSATSLDLRLGKVVPIGRRRSANVFVEMFNVLNTLNYGDYIGTITSTRFGMPTTAAPRRRTQLGFRLDF